MKGSSRASNAARNIGVRLAGILFVLWGVVTIVFFLSRVLPGDPVALLSGPVADPATMHATTLRLGLDKSIPEQYAIYLRGLAHGDLGTSFTTGRPVDADLFSRAPATLELVTVAFVISIALSICLAAWAAWQQGKVVDGLVRGATVAGVAVPTFWLGLLLLLVFWKHLRWAPAPVGRLGILTSPPPHVSGSFLIDSALAGQWATFRDAVGHLVLPTLTLVVVLTALLTQILRAKMVEVLASDYSLGARALGIPTRTRLFNDSLKNALVPVLPVWASAFGFLIAGDVFVEKIYSWPGVGLYGVNAIANSDYPAILGFVLFATVVYVLAFLAADLVTDWLDPRVRIR